MIISRYITKEIVITMLAVTVIALLIFICNEFVRYLGRAADGTLAGSVIFQLLLLEVPVLLALLLPLGFYLGILIIHGRLYSDNEMTVLAASGVSRWQILWMTMKIAVVVAAIVAILMLWVNPKIMGGRDKIFKHDGKSALIQTIQPGRFRVVPRQNAVLYVQSLSRDHKNAEDIFVARKVLKKHPQKAASKSTPDKKTAWQLMTAEKAYQQRFHGTNMLVLENGYRYLGQPGMPDYRIVKFRKFMLRLPKFANTATHDEDAKSTWQLLQASDKKVRDKAILEWRISLPLSVFLLAFLAIPLARVNPRQGKFTKLVPAILIYIIYANLMFVTRSWVKYDETPVWLGMWWVHGLLFIVACFFWWLDIRPWLRKKQKKMQPQVLNNMIART